MSAIETMRRANVAYDNVEDVVKEDLALALNWASTTLTQKEGCGHIFQVLPYKGGVQCEFFKPEWAGSHCGKPMPTGSEAIVQAVCEYLNGL